MKNSNIRHPENSFFVIRRDWQVKALTADVMYKPTGKKIKRNSHAQCGAEILSVLEFHTVNAYANTILKSVMEKAIKKGKKVHSFGEWRPYTFGYLMELLLNSWSIKTVIFSVDLLVERRFVQKDVPEDIIRSYANPGSPFTWLRLNHQVINKWIDANMPKSWGKRIDQPDELDLPTPPEDEPDLFPEEQGETREEFEADRLGQTGQDLKSDGPTGTEAAAEALDTLSIDRMVTVVCNFHRHIHAKSDKYIYDENRKSAVKARLKEKRTLAQCAQAIIGNLYSDYHQARHPENTTMIYDDIDLIMRNAKKFENHLRYAETKGVTEAIALNELQAFAKGEGSKYAKIKVRTPQNKPEQQERPLKDLPDSLLRRYRDFAREIAAFFPSNMKAADVLELCKTVTSLAAAGKGLDREDALLEALTPAVRTFGEPGRDIEIEVEKFVSTFCKVQSLNSGE